MKKLSFLTAALFAGVALAASVNSTSASLTVQNANSNTGACTNASCAVSTLSVASGTIFSSVWSVQNTVSVNLSGTFSATVTFQASYDEGATWNNTPCAAAVTSATQLSPLPVVSATAAGNWVCDVGGATTFRAVASTYTSGTVVVLLEAYNSVGLQAIGALPFVTDAQQRIVHGASSGVSYNYTTLVPLAAAAESMVAIEAPPVASGRVYLRKLTICEDGGALQGTAAPRKLVLFPTTGVSSGGISTQVPVKLDVASAAYGGIARTGDGGALTTVPAVGSVAEAQALDEFSLMVNAASTALNPFMCVTRVYDGTSGLQPIAFGGTVAGAASGADSGVAIADLTGGGSPAGNFIITAQFDVEPK